MKKVKKLVRKRPIDRLEMITKIGRSGNIYLFMKDTYGSYHVFSEIEAKSAAADCGARITGRNTRQACAEICGF